MRRLRYLISASRFLDLWRCATDDGSFNHCYRYADLMKEPCLASNSPLLSSLPSVWLLRIISTYPQRFWKPFICCTASPCRQSFRGLFGGFQSNINRLREAPFALRCGMVVVIVIWKSQSLIKGPGDWQRLETEMSVATVIIVAITNAPVIQVSQNGWSIHGPKQMHY